MFVAGFGPCVARIWESETRPGYLDVKRDTSLRCLGQKHRRNGEKDADTNLQGPQVAPRPLPGTRIRTPECWTCMVVHCLSSTLPGGVFAKQISLPGSVAPSSRPGSTPSLPPIALPTPGGLRSFLGARSRRRPLSSGYEAPSRGTSRQFALVFASPFVASGRWCVFFCEGWCTRPSLMTRLSAIETASIGKRGANCRGGENVVCMSQPCTDPPPPFLSFTGQEQASEGDQGRAGRHRQVLVLVFLSVL